MHHTYHTFDWTCDYCQTIISGVRPNKCYEIECDLQGTQWICEQCYQPRPQTNPTKPHPKLALTTPTTQKETKMTRKQFRQLYTYYNYIPYYLRIALRLPAAWESHNKKRDRNWVLVKYHTQSYSGTRAPTWVKSWWENEPPARWLSSSMGIDGVWRNGKYILWHKPEGKFRFRKTQTFKIKNNSLVKGDTYLRAKQLREL